MNPLDHFKDYIRHQVENYDYQEAYRAVLEDSEYCPLELRRIVVCCIYHLELNLKAGGHNTRQQIVLGAYLKMLTKEKYHPTILTENLLFTIYTCMEVRDGRITTSPTAPEGLYI